MNLGLENILESALEGKESKQEVFRRIKMCAQGLPEFDPQADYSNEEADSRSR